MLFLREGSLNGWVVASKSSILTRYDSQSFGILGAAEIGTASNRDESYNVESNSKVQTNSPTGAKGSSEGQRPGKQSCDIAKP